jgi:hypothetical protein
MSLIDTTRHVDDQAHQHSKFVNIALQMKPILDWTVNANLRSGAGDECLAGARWRCSYQFTVPYSWEKLLYKKMLAVIGIYISLACNFHSLNNRPLP